MQEYVKMQECFSIKGDVDRLTAAVRGGDKIGAFRLVRKIFFKVRCSPKRYLEQDQLSVFFENLRSLLDSEDTCLKNEAITAIEYLLNFPDYIEACEQNHRIVG